MNDPNRPETGYPAPNPNGHPPPPPSYASVPPPAYYNQQPYYNNTAQNYYPDPYAPQRATFLRRVLGFMIAAVIIIGTILFIIWLVLRPRLPEFRVDSFTVSNLNLSSSGALTGTFDVRFTVRNPNKKITLSYTSIEANIFYRDGFITQNTLPPFRESTKNETTLQAGFSALNAYVDGFVVDGINKARAKGGNLDFNLRMISRIGFKAGAWRARTRTLKVFCGDLSVGIASNAANGTMSGGPKQCRVGI